MAGAGNPAVHMVALKRQAGLGLMDLLMREDVRELFAERSQRQAEKTAYRPRNLSISAAASLTTCCKFRSMDSTTSLILLPLAGSARSKR